VRSRSSGPRARSGLTDADPPAPPRAYAPAAEREPDAVTRQIRGSSLLLAGRVLSLAVALLTQILIVRHLSQTSFGVFAYALSVVAIGQTVATFGLDRALTRFVPIYHERADGARLLGTIVLVAGTVATLGAGVIGAVVFLRTALPGTLDGPEIAPLLLILVFLSPLQALDTVLIGLFAVLGRSRAIFFRMYVLAPVLRLAVVAVAVVAGAGVLFIAAGYVLAAAFGSALYGAVLYRVVRAEGLLAGLRLRDARLPARDVFGLTIPLLTTDLVVVLIGASDVLLLGYFRAAADVAALAVVKPIAELNQIALASFGLLFIPVAARLFARDDDRGMNDLYWRTAAWVAVVSFPVFAVTFVLAEPLVALLYGARYEPSGAFLAVLALGFYVQASLGFNGTTLMVFGKMRYVVGLNALTIVVNLTLNLLLIPRYGALGAAAGTSATHAVHNLLKQLALAHATSVEFFRRTFARTYGTIGAGVGVVAAARLLDASAVVGAAAALAVCVLVLALNRRVLDVAGVFPELGRVPFLRADR
jgi:O-antigen/teichoic acid export membrane protein